jgi:biopolymer transport protein ExbB
MKRLQPACGGFVVVAIALTILASPMIATAFAADETSPAPATGALRPDWLPTGAGSVAWYLLLLLSVVSTGLIIDHLLKIRRGRLMPPAVFQELEAKVKGRMFDDAVRFCQDLPNDSLLTRVVLAGVERYRQNYSIAQAEVRAVAQEEGQEQVGQLYRRTEALGAIGVVAPLLGLLGTVQSLIGSLGAIAAAGDAARPADVAGAVSKALVITALGLCVAIPSLGFQSVFRTRIDALAQELGRQAGQILQTVGRQGSS